MSTPITTTPRDGTALPPMLYSPPTTGGRVDLFLDANEGPGGLVDPGAIVAALRADGTRRYPSPAGLERSVAEKWGVDASRVVVTAGGDESIDRACRAFLKGDRELILPTPTFEMIARYAALAGARVVSVAWSKGAYPIEAVLGSVSERTGMIAVVSPNNPTGAVATGDDLRRLAAAAPGAVLLVDLAYAEFADEDLMEVALGLPNTVVVRTFSKAFGLAGVRVGYSIASEPNARVIRATGSPYPVSGVGLAAAGEAIRVAPERLPSVVARVREERERLIGVLRALGAEPLPSQGNFVLAEFADAEWVWRALAGVGIGVRRFRDGTGLDRSLRITCPGEEHAFDRLCAGLRSVLRPEALLFDMDGVLADVSGSYRRAIVMTAESFGVRLSPGDIAAAKAEGNANNDWALTHKLVTERGAAATLGQVTARFERLYQGENGTAGLKATERLIPGREMLERLGRRVRLGIVTGRPRRDCERFLARFGLGELFGAVVCMEDAPAKPDPASVRIAMERLGVGAAWMIGDTPDDAIAAWAARVVPIGISPPGETDGRTRGSLHRAGAARVLASLSELEELLP